MNERSLRRAPEMAEAVSRGRTREVVHVWIRGARSDVVREVELWRDTAKTG